MGKTVNDIINDILRREGGPSNDPVDKGGRTAFGISEKANADLWADGKVTEEEARDRYLQRYVVATGYDKIPDESLRAHMIDFGVNSGPYLATMKLQEILGVEKDGVIGSETLAAIASRDSKALNQALVIERVKMFVKIVQKTPTQVKFLGGWVNRAFEFLS